MAPQGIHLLLLIHGMWGHPGHLSELARIIQEKHSQVNDDGLGLHVLSAQANREESTYDGIDWGGERVADEVLEEVQKLERDGKKVSHFSVTGYSLGGLLGRYVIGILHQKGFFDSKIAVNFNTIATPHIGLPRYPSLVSAIFSSLGPKLLSRTGEQFYCVDQWSPSGRPLLEVMADPGRIFYQALSLFKHIRIYANAVNDLTVPYVTSAIELEDPFSEAATNGIQITFNEDYLPIIQSYEFPLVPPAPTPKPVIFSPSWFHSLKPNRPLLPPFLQLRFPMNLMLYTLLPLLIPVGISLALIRFTLDSRSSRARIKLLEADASTPDRQKLIHILAELEREVEDTMTDIMDSTSAVPAAGAIQDVDHDSDANSVRTLDRQPSHMEARELTRQISDPSHSIRSKRRPCRRRKHKPRPERPILTPLQKRIVTQLNQLPITKVLAYFDNFLNAHGVIICRDVARFEVMRDGQNVVKHWADHFVH